MNKRLDGKIEDVYWAQVSQEKTICSKEFQKDHYDLVIVGAGYLGLSTALHAAQKGMSVMVLEEYSIGSGASGRNGGVLVPAYPGGRTIEDVKASIGNTKGAGYSTLVANAPEYLFDKIREYDIKCHPVQNGFIQPAHSDASLLKARRVFESWTKHCHDLKWLSGDEIKEETGAHGYIGGWFQKTGGTVEPYALAQGIARIALDVGADILEGHCVDEIKTQGDKYLVTSNNETFKAKSVFIATNAYTKSLENPLGKSVIPVRLFHTMTRPLTAQERKVVLHKGITFTDLRKSGGFGRLDSLGRLQSGGAVFSPLGKEYGMKHARLRMKELFPILDGIELEYYWEGYCAITEEWIPSFQIHHYNFYSCIGFSTRGVAISFSVGRVMADILSGDILAKDSPLSFSSKDSIRMQCFKEYLGGLAFPVYKAKDRLKLS